MHQSARDILALTPINNHRLLGSCIIYCKACYYQSMSNNEETPSAAKRSLMVIIALIVVGVAWFVWQVGADDAKKADDKKKTDTNQSANNTNKEKTDDYA